MYSVSKDYAMGFKLKLIFQLVIYLSWHHIPCTGIGERIVGGTSVTEKKYTYFVRVYYQDSFVCGGSLVRNNAVVTAAHCVSDANVNGLRVHADTINLRDEGIARKVKKVVIPNLYNERTSNYDVAVLILASAVPNSSFTAIQLQKTAVTVGTKCVVIGHGSTKESEFNPIQLQEVWIPVLSRTACQLRYAGVAYITRYMLCAWELGKDSCAGDSGGPMVCNGRLAGVVSWGVKCADSRFPGVYTDISRVYTFIERTLERFK
ncbi:trypsin alpha-3 [Bactrocera dorsalis]|uniref:Trypsin alpha-3 n=1 Tax=Bactrocera dorsalis TaxID=27457 RepID=A0A6I9V0H3_BACDO|nr:trypsin alpha-3 [Bactrocera dorsalis]